MPRSTPRMLWTFPAEDDDPFFEFFRQFANQLDASGFADSDNNNLIAFGTALFTWDATSGVLTWDDDFFFSGFTSGFLVRIPGPDSITISDGHVLSFIMPRLITGNVDASLFVSSRIAESDGVKIHDRIVISARSGTTMYFRNGVTLGDGDFGEIWERPVASISAGMTPAQKAAVNAALHTHLEFFFSPGIGISTFNLPNPTPEVYKKFNVYRNGMRLSLGLTGSLGYTQTLTTPFEVVLNTDTQNADDVVVIDAEISATV